jgi:D-threo-aldose 1-dehydrogenase
VHAHALAEACRAHHARLAQAALQFPLRHAAVERVIAGMGTIADVRADADAMRAPLPAALWERLDELNLIAARTIAPRSGRRSLLAPLPMD